MPCREKDQRMCVFVCVVFGFIFYVLPCLFMLWLVINVFNEPGYSHIYGKSNKLATFMPKNQCLFNENGFAECMPFVYNVISSYLAIVFYPKFWCWFGLFNHLKANICLTKFICLYDIIQIDNDTIDFFYYHFVLGR